MDAWNAALEADPLSAFGGVLITNAVVDLAAAEEINKIFFEVIIAPDYDLDALEVLSQKKNRIILILKNPKLKNRQFRSLLNGVLIQDKDTRIETEEDLKVVTEKSPSGQEIEDLLFANKIVKHTKSNAIVLAKNKQMCASGVGQTSRVDALKQAIDKAHSFDFIIGAVASDASSLPRHSHHSCRSRRHSRYTTRWFYQRPGLIDAAIKRGVVVTTGYDISNIK